MISLWNKFHWEKGEELFPREDFLQQAFSSSLPFTHLPRKKRMTWEWRSFWSEDTSSLPLPLGRLGLYSFKEFESTSLEDMYLSFKGSLLNIKLRKGKLVHKPLKEKADNLQAFGAKKKQSFPLAWESLYPLFPRLFFYKDALESPKEVIEMLRKNGYEGRLVEVQKKVYRYEFSAGLQIEVSEVKLHKHPWYSLCLEGLSYSLVKEAAKLVAPPGGEEVGYAAFLQKIWE